MTSFVMNIIGIILLIVVTQLLAMDKVKDMHTTAELDDAIQTAYNLGVSECPMNKHCMAFDIQLKRLTLEDVEGLVE